MPRRTTILLLAIVAVIALLVGIMITKDNEPRYQGRSLSEWSLHLQTDDPMASAATNAIRAIGTNALPLLLQRISYEVVKNQNTRLRFVGGHFSNQNRYLR